MTRFERYYNGKPHKCAICNHPVIYDDKKHKFICNCAEIDMHLTKEDFKKHKKQGIEWRKTCI